MVHLNEGLLRGAYGLRDEQEVASFRDLLHEDIVFHMTGGDLHGPDEVLSMLASSDDIAGGTTQREVHALFADDDFGMVLVTIRAERPGRRYEQRQVHVYRFVDGRIIEFWEYLQDPRQHEDFWS
jgi:ketosteroid isomerase-like protein